MLSYLIHGVGFVLTTIAIALCTSLAMDYVYLGIGLHPALAGMIILLTIVASARFLSALRSNYLFLQDQEISERRARQAAVPPHITRWPSGYEHM